MDLRQLDMFRAVAEEGSFTRAAERVHVTQSAISRQVKLLEDELGVRLLHRGGKGARATPQGALLLQASHRVQRELEEAVAQISATETLQRGALRLAGGMTACMLILPRLLRRFRRLYPHVDLRVRSGPNEAVLRLIRNREIDLALMTLPLVARDLALVPALREELVVVTAPRHALARGRTLEPHALARHPLILYEAGSNTRKLIDGFLLEQHVPVEVAMETENVEIIKAMVAAGLGITVVPYTAVAKDVRAGRFACARFKGQRLHRDSAWVHLAGEHQPRAVTEMLRVFESLRPSFVTGPKG